MPFTKFEKILEALTDNGVFALVTSAITALINPQPTILETIKLAVATTLLGTVVGSIVQDIEFLAPYKFAIVAFVGLYGKSIYTYIGTQMNDPLAFFRNVRRTIWGIKRSEPTKTENEPKPPTI